ncbi:discoidin domain-containing protein [Tamlana agarivorans]|uniref:Discoidin domain-containing protein n=1 Tax=Pseudotamlana agarivorans TaxID=481183 RepID=A0ACC5U9K8_9FLAO|nr:discoidin domain-containing protein [Tamlana agarivorans]MBU2950955.1 discoidin domain-containing protein [Tamlana agarivorans]
MNLKLNTIFAIVFMAGYFTQLHAQPGYAGEWKKTRLYGHSYNSGDFSDEEYNWIRDHFEYFTIEKTHLRSIYGNPSHEETSKITATKLIEANPRCKPLSIYSIGSGYPLLFESQAEILQTNPEYFLYDANGDVDALNLENSGENDWYVNTVNDLVESSDLHGVFLDGYKGAYTAHTDNVQYMSDRITGYRLVNGMDFAPNGLSIRGWPECLNYSDGVFIDAFFRRRVMSKEAGVVLLDACLEIPNDQMFVCFSAYDGYSSTFEFSHAAYLIVAHENTYYRWVDEGDHLWNSSSLMTWHDVFDKEMGEPLGKAVKDGYVYTRVFEYCTVTIDVENITSHIEWDQDNRPDTGDENLALSGTASQSSTAYTGVASRAIDGNTGGTWSNGSVSHTANETNPWWELDLGAVKSIGEVVVYGRTDACCKARLNNFTVTVMDANRNTVFSQGFTSFPDPSTTIDIGDVLGQIIQIQLNGTNALSLAEVEVYEGAYNQISNLALSGTASQSTTAYSGPASRAIDGNTNGVWSNSSVSHTAAVNDSWWMVTLDNNAFIEEVIVYNRTDVAYMDRLNNFTIEVLNSANEITFTQTITTAPNPSVLINVGGVEANRVRIIQNNNSTALSLAEVEVYGTTSSATAKSSSNKNMLEADFTNVFKLYPNPVKDFVTIQLDTIEPANYHVVNMLGQVMLSSTIHQGANVVDLSSLPTGIYTVRVSNEVTSQMKRIIKE